jgi:hypothetical protein
MAVPTLYTYTLQTNETAVGRMTVKLYSEFNGLTIPAFSSLYYEETNEKYDAIPTTIELEEMICSFSEDYTNYEEGFWYKVLAGYAELQFLLDDGNGDSHFFWGRILGQEIQLRELAIVDNVYVRRGEFRVVSLLVRLKESLSSDVLTEAQSHAFVVPGCIYASNTSTGADDRFCAIFALLASITKVGFGQSYDINDILKQTDDIQFKDSGGTWHGLEDVCVFAGIDTFAWDILTETGFLIYKYPSAYELLVGICKSFHLVPRYFYNTTTSRHSIELLTRGRSYSASTYSVPEKSTAILEAYRTQSVMTSQKNKFDTGGGLATAVDKRYVFDGTYTTNAVLFGGRESEQDFDYLFILKDTEETFDNTSGFPIDTFGYMLYTDSARITDSRFWDYATGATSTSTFLMLRYAIGRFGQSKRGYERVYPTIKANDGSTDSHANNYCLRTTSIADGLTTRTMYAVEVTKNVITGKSTILWNEV